MYRKLEPKIVAVFREGYTRKLFQGDLLGGLTVGVVALPLAIALAIFWLPIIRRDPIEQVRHSPL